MTLGAGMRSGGAEVALAGAGRSGALGAVEIARPPTDVALGFDRLDTDQALALVEADQPHALRVAAEHGDLADRVRTSVPLELISMSSFRSHLRGGHQLPLRSVVCMAMTPWPPRPCTGNSSTG
jgi:hypothetical protein